MPSEFLLADADVLIDYQVSDLSILEIVASEFSGLYVLQPILDTVDGLREKDCARIGIELVSVETETLLEAGARSGPLSFEDWLAFLVCKERGWTCVTNDRVLIRECLGAGIQVRRGLGLMLELVALGALDRLNAERVAKEIQKANPFHINERVMEEFRRELGKRSS